MSANAPTPRGSVQQAKTTYISWGDYDFELIGNNTYRPRLTAANKTEVVTNVETYTSLTPKKSKEDMTIRVLYDPELWDELAALKEAGTIKTLETSDGFSHSAMISEMGEVAAEVDGPITEMEVIFSFPTVVSESSTTNSGSNP